MTTLQASVQQLGSVWFISQQCDHVIVDLEHTTLGEDLSSQQGVNSQWPLKVWM